MWYPVHLWYAGWGGKNILPGKLLGEAKLKVGEVISINLSSQWYNKALEKACVFLTRSGVILKSFESTADPIG
jgi:hypothetical protein